MNASLGNRRYPHQWPEGGGQEDEQHRLAGAPGGTAIDIGRDGSEVFVSESPKGDICEVVSSSAAPNSDGSVGGVPRADQHA